MSGLSLRRLSDRYGRELETRAASLLETPSLPETGGPARRHAPASPPSNMRQAGDVHRAIMNAVDQVLTMGLTHENAGDAPPQLRMAVRLLRRLEPVMLEELAKIPEEECLQMVRLLSLTLAQLADRLEPQPEHGDDNSSAPARTDQPPSA